jgi:oxygen-independent coproporphyrinogen-3 oxidase
LAGIYIHIPFCKQACTYCNFHFSTNLQLKRKLLDALAKEIALVQKPSTIETIYLGGGTPSLLFPEEINELLSCVREHFTVNSSAEVTLEANPDDIQPVVLASWLAMGINRLSLGVQSFNQQELKWMNRAHNADQSIKSIQDIRAAGFTNFSVDLIYGSPLLNNEDFIKNVEIILENKIPHVSAYALTVEPKTALYKMISMKKSEPVDETRQAEQFTILLSMMEGGGLEQYEISNFAKGGYRSRHNSSYWLGKPYFGFGPAAHSYDGKDSRRWNIANNALYIQSLEQGIVAFEEEKLTIAQQLNEVIMISLRTKEGLNLSAVGQRFGEQYGIALLKAAQKFIDENKLVNHGATLCLTNEGKFFADGIAAQLFV